MNSQPIETTIPPNSRIVSRLDGASFYDAWSITIASEGLDALGYFIAAVLRTPRWIDLCMTARNRVGKLVGLKDLGTLSGLDASKPASEYQPGERVGIFTIFENAVDEAIIGDQDKHLNVVLSIHRQEKRQAKQVTITVTTVVHVKNMLGRFYMLPVKPMHRLIAPSVLASIGQVETQA